MKISYSVGSPALSNRLVFPKFFRTYMPDTLLNKARLHIIRDFGWKRVATIHENEDLFSLVGEELKAATQFCRCYSFYSLFVFLVCRFVQCVLLVCFNLSIEKQFFILFFFVGAFCLTHAPSHSLFMYFHLTASVLLRSVIFLSSNKYFKDHS